MNNLIIKEDTGHLRTSPTQQLKINEAFRLLNARDHLLPIKVTRFFQRKIDEEITALGHTEGPLHRMVYPTKERLLVRAPGEVADFVDDRENMPDDALGNIIQKYRNRMLFMPTSTCASHCQYCFRQDVLSEQHETGKKIFDKAILELDSYLSTHPDVEEVILSGGDPMTLPTELLKSIFSTIKSHKQVRSIRIHTKTISYSPQVFKSDEKLKLLASAGVRLVFHLTHPYELCDVVRKMIKRIQRAGIPCYNQFPILRQINDHPEILRRHLETLDRLGIRNLSVFIPDPINFSAPFRINLARLINIINELNWRSPSWINSTRFVMDTKVGKVRREDITHYDTDLGIAIFERDGKTIRYPDFPANLDIPGDIETILWKDYVSVS
ncbi:radical SAM protein [Photorhabdus temperata]|uniref:Lysine 2,3-aminomutase n=1 Tax=Photorhabdus temperata subsp. temperata Meg1 TaxID=1393735 RepID=A0A081S131_PHOTE|nr:radical SAM protein [Photorhabdus temperata]KER04634.1 lysine 2,3-aminomutase [Photorhabdus temperata subsp. temperata Meg1]MCT8346514.1 radical SAM protein [Photorhabdus temperata]